MESLPKGLYDALPYVYMTVGAVTTAVLETELKFVPAALFFVAGALVLAWRLAARGERPQRLPAHLSVHMKTKPHGDRPR
jgi:hypothetical protein